IGRLKQRRGAELAAQEEKRKREDEAHKEMIVKQLEEENRAREILQGEKRRLAEQAEDLAETKRLDEQHRTDLAARSQELRRALDELEDARAATKKAEAQLEVALTFAEEAKSGPRSETETPVDISTLTRSLQAELKRVGCDPGIVDGKWGDSTRSALVAFAERAKLDLKTNEPDRQALDAVMSTKD